MFVMTFETFIEAESQNKNGPGFNGDALVTDPSVAENTSSGGLMSGGSALRALGMLGLALHLSSAQPAAAQGHATKEPPAAAGPLRAGEKKAPVLKLAPKEVLRANVVVGKKLIEMPTHPVYADKSLAEATMAPFYPPNPQNPEKADHRRWGTVPLSISNGDQVIAFQGIRFSESSVLVEAYPVLVHAAGALAALERGANFIAVPYRASASYSQVPVFKADQLFKGNLPHGQEVLITGYEASVDGVFRPTAGRGMTIDLADAASADVKREALKAFIASRNVPPEDKRTIAALTRVVENSYLIRTRIVKSDTGGGPGSGSLVTLPSKNGTPFAQLVIAGAVYQRIVIPTGDVSAPFVECFLAQKADVIRRALSGASR
ncbi:MAG: hypothetical protein RIQ56_237 [Candidatus Parcubacteria bacterium]